MTESPNHIKQREISFRGPVDPDLVADNAIFLLAEVDGVTETHKLGNLSLSVTYDLSKITLEQIECALAEIGFHLDNSLMNKLRRAIFYFTEDNERSHLGLAKTAGSQGCAMKVFAARYKQISHGCRDPRPEHLRRYL